MTTTNDYTAAVFFVVLSVLGTIGLLVSFMLTGDTFSFILLVLNVFCLVINTQTLITFHKSEK